MIIFMSWLKKYPGLMDAFVENRLVMLIDSGLGRLEDDAMKVHEWYELENWTKDTFGVEHRKYGSDLVGFIFKDDVEAKLFMINFGITFTPYMDPDL